MRIPFSSALAFVFVAATPALADLTPEDAWRAIQRQAEDTGFQVTVGTRSRTGDVLELADVRYFLEKPEMSVSLRFDTMQFVDIGGGEVLMAQSDAPFIVRVQSPDEDLSIIGKIGAPGAETILSGSVAALQSEYSIPHFEVRVDDVHGSAGPVEIDAEIVLKTVEGRQVYQIAPADDVLPVLEATLTAELTTFDLKFLGTQDDPGVVTVNARVHDVSIMSEGAVMPLGGVDMPEGFASVSNIRHGLVDADIRSEADDGVSTVDLRAAGGSTESGVLDGSAYSVGSLDDLEISISASAMPFPVLDLSVERIESRHLIPVEKSETDREFGIAGRIDGITFSESLWAGLDPQKALPRDPIDLEFALTGLGNLSIDFGGSGSGGGDDLTAFYGGVKSVALDSLSFGGLGAQVSASGQLRNTEAEGADPYMVGSIDIYAVGLRGLLDNLRNGGILPSEMAMAGNMFLGMFTQPGDEPDSVRTSVELKLDGSISVNGVTVR